MKHKIVTLALLLLGIVSSAQEGNRVGLRLNAGLSTIFTEDSRIEFQSIFSTGIVGFGEHGKKKIAIRWEAGYENKGGFEKLSNLLFNLHYGSIGLMAVLKNVPENGSLQAGMYGAMLFNNSLENGSTGQGYPSFSITLQRWDWGPQLGYEYILLKKETFAISADIRAKYGAPTLLEYFPTHNFSFGVGFSIGFL